MANRSVVGCQVELRMAEGTIRRMDDHAIPPLIEKLRDHIKEVRDAAAEAIEKIEVI